jgi:hypothetical protein
MFYIVAILFTIVSPLVVPVAVTLLHAIKNRRQNVATARLTASSADRIVTGPALMQRTPAAA